LIPYASYSPQQAYADFFGRSKPLTQDLAIGLNKLIDFHPDWSRFDMRAPGVPTWEIGLQATLQRRIVNGGPDSSAVLFNPSLKWTSTDHHDWPHCFDANCSALSASLGVNLTRRWFDQANDNSERTWGVSPIFTVAWGLPDRFFGGSAGHYGSPELDFQAAYNDQSSTVDAHSSRQWTVGLIIKAGLTF
jgi:hypothetical protein